MGLFSYLVTFVTGILLYQKSKDSLTFVIVFLCTGWDCDGTRGGIWDLCGGGKRAEHHHCSRSSWSHREALRAELIKRTNPMTTTTSISFARKSSVATLPDTLPIYLSIHPTIYRGSSWTLYSSLYRLCFYLFDENSNVCFLLVSWFGFNNFIKYPSTKISVLK